jgi:CheY-like chemotaxis protein
MKQSGVSVVTASGPIQAISILEEASDKIDVAILDYNMPIMNGCVLARRLRLLRPQLKIILYSGKMDIPLSEMSSVDVFIPKGDGMARLIGQVVPGLRTHSRTPAKKVLTKSAKKRARSHLERAPTGEVSS